MIPQPVKGIVILFPVTEKYEDFRKQEEATLHSNYPNTLTFMKQTIGNACGTIALLHTLLNNEELIKPDSFISTLKKEVKGMSPDTIASHLEKHDKLAAIHDER